MAETFDPFAMGAERLNGGNAPAFDPFAMGAEKLDASPSQAQQKDRPGFFRKMDSFVRGAADALTFGTADEISAFMGSMTGVGGDAGDYTKNLEAQRSTDRQRMQEDPVAMIGGQLAGAVGVGAAAAPAKLMTLGQRMKQGAALGALGGAAYGAGSGEGAEGRALGAVTGAGVGGVGGYLLPAATNVGGKIYNKLMDATARPAVNALRGTVNPRGNALRLTQRALSRDNMTPQGASGVMQDAINAGDDSMMLMDTGGDNIRRLGRFASNIPGEGADKIKEKVFVRQLAQSDRVSDAIREGLGDPERYYGTIDQILESRARASKPLYDKFRATPVPFTKKLEDILGRGAVMRKALKGARDMSDMDGGDPMQFFANIADDGSYTIQRVPNASELDLIKRALDDIVDANTTTLPNGSQKMNNFGRVVKNLQRELVNEVDSLNPYYKPARMAYSSASESLDAVTKGGKLLNADPELAARELAKMSEPDRQLARIGVAKALTDKVQASPDGLNVVRKIFGSPKQRKLLEKLFPDQASMDEFKASMEREAAKSRTKQAIYGNSTTAQQLTDIADNQIDMGVIGNAMTGRLGAAAGSIVQKTLSRATVVNEATAKEIADIITSSDPQVSRQILAEMQKMAERDQRVARNFAMVRNILRGGFITEGAQQGGAGMRDAILAAQ